ncbi:hypothetical protein [Agrobacterium pusense]|jgi:hypothetical protein|uniref:hypothetical protein n=1 Tax=Agrobacterium pusense TaxID=648995 RepID=UPI002FDDC446
MIVQTTRISRNGGVGYLQYHQWRVTRRIPSPAHPKLIAGQAASAPSPDACAGAAPVVAGMALTVWM